MKISKIGLIYSLTLIFSLHGACEKAFFDNLNSLQGDQLFSFIENAGYEAFGKENLMSDFDANVLKQGLSEKNYEIWEDAIRCLFQWYKNIGDSFKGGWLARPPIAMEVYGKTIKDFSMVKFLPGYADRLKSEKDIQKLKQELQVALTQMDGIFVLSLKNLYRLPNISSYSGQHFYKEVLPKLWKRRSPETVLSDYKKLVGINFNPKTFFAAYEKIKKDFARINKKKPITSEEIFGILLHTKVIKIPEIKGQTIEANRMKAVGNFVNMLEELVFQSELVKSNASLDNKTQVASREIIEKLYFLYPNIVTETLEKKMNFVPEAIDRSHLIIFAYSKMILMVLRSYLRTANYLLHQG